jgi:hypothetical protein
MNICKVVSSEPSSKSRSITRRRISGWKNNVRKKIKLASVEPKNKRFLLRISSGFGQPVEESSAMLLVDRNVAGELRKRHRWLSRESRNSIQLLLFCDGSNGGGGG